MSKTKICSKCGFEGDESKFKKNSSICKECANALGRQYNKTHYIPKPRNKNIIIENDILFRLCIKCNEKKELTKEFFRFRKETGNFCNYCLVCELKQKSDYYFNNKEKIQAAQKIYAIEHADEIDAYQQQYSIDNKEKRKQYKIDHKEEQAAWFNNYQKEKYHNDPAFKFKRTVGISIYHALKKESSSKNGETFTKFVPYSMSEAVFHLEKQFEPWMTWDNWSKYDPKTWDENDPTTWTWQLDHIIPQADLPYKTMEDENFKRCWALENLRPLNAKQNLYDGLTRKRHKNVSKRKSKKKKYPRSSDQTRWPNMLLLRMLSRTRRNKFRPFGT